MQDEIEQGVTHYIYSFGDLDGPFQCESDDGYGCGAECWKIYTIKPTGRVELLNGAGKALCDKHAPKNLILDPSWD